MRGAILIYGGNKKSREETVKEKVEQLFKKLLKEHPDILYLENAKNKKSIGINKVREATKFLSQRPYQSKNKAVIVKNAHLLTNQAQNAFLKTLEEPPTYATIILEAPSKGELLDTVLSRCQQVKINPQKKKAKDTLNWKKIRKLSEGNKLELAKKLSKKSTPGVITIIERWIESERSSLSKNKQSLNNLRVLSQVRKDLKGTNVNSQIALEFLLLQVS